MISINKCHPNFAKIKLQHFPQHSISSTNVFPISHHILLKIRCHSSGGHIQKIAPIQPPLFNLPLKLQSPSISLPLFKISPLPSPRFNVFLPSIFPPFCRKSLYMRLGLYKNLPPYNLPFQPPTEASKFSQSLPPNTCPQ